MTNGGAAQPPDEPRAGSWPAPPAQSYPPPPSGSPPAGFPPPAVPPPAAPPPGAAPYPTAPYPLYQPVRTSGLAIASMVLGIVWIFWLGSMLAVIFGHVALSQIKRSMGALGGRGMAIAGLVLGYLGLATLALVIVLAATGAIDTTTTAECRADYFNLSAAEARYEAVNGHVTDERTLVAENYLSDESDLHDVVLLDGNARTATRYRIIPTNRCD